LPRRCAARPTSAQRQRQPAREIIGRAIARGELAADADAHTLATYTSVVMQGMAAQARDGTTRDQLQAAAAQAMQAWPWNSTAPQ